MSYKDSAIYKAHELIGFPTIETEKQLDILVNNNYSPILDLCPEIKNNGFPLALLNEYITIKKDTLKQHLKEINYIQIQLDTYNKTSDGFWLRRVDKEFEFFERERGNEFGHKKIKTEDEILDIYVGLIGWCCK